MRREMLIEHDGLTLTIKQWATKAGLSKEGLKSRLLTGMSMADALKPKGTYRKVARKQGEPRAQPHSTAHKRKPDEITLALIGYRCVSPFEVFAPRLHA